MQTSSIIPEAAEREALNGLVAAKASGWQTVRVHGGDRVAHVAAFAPLGWTFFVTESAGVFYAAADGIMRQSAYILGGSIAAALTLLFLFSGYLTRPLRLVADAMREIIATNDLTRRVEVLYKDETGRLGHTFNLMSEELGKAYSQIKGYALRAAIAQTKEQKIRHIFQKYVPRTVLESFFANPEKMLVGENRVLAILFSDVRGFTTISEAMRPDQMVESLNNYFSRMVDIIMNRGGIVDKYIGDAVMAFFGAPVRHEDDALQSVIAGFEMLEAVEEFNKWQSTKGRPLFHIGVGVNYGAVTVGNIGSERKMDYTVIGDMVNLASRLEGLTKKYRTPFLVSDSVHRKISGKVHCRQIDTVAVKGRARGTAIYEVKQTLTDAEEKAWPVHDAAMTAYLERRFEEAGKGFLDVEALLPRDYCAQLFVARCAEYAKHPPPAGWTGVVEMTEK
jgi:class 3 adenylate cyclase/HAMP domain-containing protein